ncbi:helix-turn-helix domain-containing protein [Spirosoma sp. HMF4905]|uniref:Helix-turn-helix domain-containing protein n=1 Tax=Spirosoma arboris TaxID=2682092 RepID=A0A7K1SJ79_9BACT|nr:helix-turn-helix domain-containing protein [Spirosoma arboris]MVM33860.1 helix-turn-helix domain-containing protein [Spirosoma arboris]
MATKHENRFANMIWAVTEEAIFKDEIVLDFHSFVRILSGEMKVVQADQSYTFLPGDTILFPRHQLSSVIKKPRDGKPYKAIVLALTTAQLQQYYSKTTFTRPLHYSGQTQPLGSHPLLDSFFASVIPYFNLQDQLPLTIAQLKIEEAISIIRSISKNADAILTDFSDPGKLDLVAFMEKNFMFNIPLEKFAYLTGRSLSTFNRDFRKTFQMTPQKWLTHKRLELARFQIAKNHKKPVDVYLETGFENLSHFSFAFKKQFGYAPSESI